MACGGTDKTVGDGDGGSSGDGSGAGGSQGANMSNGVGGAGSGGSAQAVVINEIMFDPKAVGDDFGEWLELYNPSSKAVDLSGWTLRDQVSNTHTLDNLSIGAGQYLVLGRYGATDANGNYDADYVYGEDFKLSNDGDSVIVEDADLCVIFLKI